MPYLNLTFHEFGEAGMTELCGVIRHKSLWRNFVEYGVAVTEIVTCLCAMAVLIGYMKMDRYG